MLPEANSLEFGEFTLDPVEKILLRNGERLPINPKTFQLLVTLIENQGHLVEKDRLMKALWADSFVEEANLSFTVSLLRKALGDSPQHPRFVETIPRRGYRFIADVQERGGENGAEHSSSEPVTESSAGAYSPMLRRLFVAAVSLLMVGAGGGFWYASKNLNAEAPVLLNEFSSEKLSTDGKVYSAITSPDAAFVVYSNETPGMQSLWLRQLDSSSNIQIIPPSEVAYFGLALSPDSRTLYFARVQQDPEDGQQADIYRVSVFGGVPVKIINQAQGSISLSADGGKISFIRCTYAEDEYCSLWIADSDGNNEKRLLSRPRPIRIGTARFSPDGKTIAFGVGQSRTWGNEFSLMTVDVESGVESEVTPERFFNIKHLAWLPGNRELLLTARKFSDTNFRIWQVSAATGVTAPLTQDADDYAALSLNRDGSVLVATKNRADYRLNVYQPEISAVPRVLGEASTLGFAANGKILFSSAMAGNHEIWSMNPDGSDRRQLTNDPAMDFCGVASPDNSFIFFESNRTGEAQVWRMNADGSDQLQITQKTGGAPQAVSPDGKWLYYTSARERKLMRISTGGGEEQLALDERSDDFGFSVLDRRGIDFAVSPDGSQVVFATSRNKMTTLVLASLTDKKTIRTFDLPGKKTGPLKFNWAPDGRSLFYVMPDAKFENNFIWKQPIDRGVPEKIADLGPDDLRETRSFAVSPDGRSFAVIQGSWKHDAVLIRGLR